MSKVNEILVYYWKLLGTLQEFGIAESIRRIRKEIFRKNSNALDISWVTGRLGVGAAPRGSGPIKVLANFNISDLIDLRAERSSADSLLDPCAFKVHWVPIYDDWKPKEFKFFEQLIQTIDRITRDRDYKILICCGAGEHRAPLGGAVALLTLGYSLGEAIELLKKARPVAELLPVYVRSLEEYIKSKNTAHGTGFKAPVSK